MLLVTTGIPETRDASKSELILGQWCLDYGAGETLGKNSKVQPFHWLSREKLAKDYDYIVALNERVLAALREKLNRHHKVEKSLRYWRIVLGPWLTLLTPIVWDRFESLRIAFSENALTEVYKIRTTDNNLVPVDYDDFTDLLNDHLWNHRLYQLILENYIEKSPAFSICEKQLPRAERAPKNTPRSWKWHIYQLFDNCISAINFKSDIVAFNSYFDYFSLTKLLSNFYQLPRKYYEFSAVHERSPEDLEARREQLGLQVGSTFEGLVNDLYLSLIPMSYLENYAALIRRTRDISLQGKVILSAVSHYNNDLFKLWTADKTESGAKLILCEHGGGIPYGYSLTSRHDDCIADKRIVWHKTYNSVQVKLSPSKLVRYLSAKRISKTDISLVCWDVPLYPYYVQSGPVSSLVLYDYEQKKIMIKHLDDTAFQSLKIRPEPGDRGWRIKQRYIEDFGVDHISTYKSMDETLFNSKLVISTYPSTNLSEAMEAGIPTIMLYNRELWETRPEFDDLVYEMFANKLFFSDPIAAAEHINKIAQAPDEWWNAIAVKKARDSFHEYCGCAKPTWLRDWTDFLEQELAH